MADAVPACQTHPTSNSQQSTIKKSLVPPSWSSSAHVVLSSCRPVVPLSSHPLVLSSSSSRLSCSKRHGQPPLPKPKPRPFSRRPRVRRRLHASVTSRPANARAGHCHRNFSLPVLHPKLPSALTASFPFPLVDQGQAERAAYGSVASENGMGVCVW